MADTLPADAQTRRALESAEQSLTTIRRAVERHNMWGCREDVFYLSSAIRKLGLRQWVIWHLIEHDLNHGGEISLSLGIPGLPAPNL